MLSSAADCVKGWCPHLTQCELDVACARREVDHQVVQGTPVCGGEKLLYDTWSAKQSRLGSHSVPAHAWAPAAVPGMDCYVYARRMEQCWQLPLELRPEKAATGLKLLDDLLYIIFVQHTMRSGIRLVDTSRGTRRRLQGAHLTPWGRA